MFNNFITIPKDEENIKLNTEVIKLSNFFFFLT